VIKHEKARFTFFSTISVLRKAQNISLLPFSIPYFPGNSRNPNMRQQPKAQVPQVR
jgi:hypothetical protein